MSAKPDLRPPVQERGGEAGKGSEAGVGFVQPQAEAAEVFQAVERGLDQVPGAVEARVIPVLHEPVALGRRARADAACAPVFAQAVGVVSFVAHHGQGLQPGGERHGMAAVGLLPGRGQQAADEAQAADGVVDLGGQAAPAASDALRRAAACAGGRAAASHAGAADVQHVRPGCGL